MQNYSYYPEHLRQYWSMQRLNPGMKNLFNLPYDGVEEPPPPDGMMVNPEYDRYMASLPHSPVSGGMGQDMMRGIAQQQRMALGPAPQQYIVDPEWSSGPKMREVESPGDDGPAQFAPPPGGGFTNWKPPGGFGPGDYPTNWKPPVSPPGGPFTSGPAPAPPPPPDRSGLFHKAQSPAIQRVAQALLSRR